MELNVMASSYGVGGGHPALSIGYDLLVLGLREYGTAVERIDVTAHFPDQIRRRESKTRDHQAAFERYLDTLPKVVFHRKRKRIEINYKSKAFFKKAMSWGYRSAGPEQVRLAMAEVADALHLIRGRVKASDDFDVDSFLKDTDNILRSDLPPQEEWPGVLERATAKRQAALAAKDPWELLDIDWDEYHPRARELLNDTFFWDCTDDIAPHGNDTGADVLADFQEWNRKHRCSPPCDFLTQLFGSWEMSPIDWLLTDKESVERLFASDPTTLTICNEASIGLAFACIKVRGSCPPDVVEMALAGLTRTSIAVGTSSTLSQDSESAWETGITRMRAKLMEFKLDAAPAR